MGGGNPLLSIPTWSQNADPLPDGQQDPFRATDCGEECAAMRIYYRTGIELPAGTLRALLPGHADHGETSAVDLTFLMHLFGLHPVGMQISSDAIQSRVRSSIGRGTPPIVLGYWLSATTLHWVLAVGASDGGLLVNDPWDGKRRQYGWDHLTSRYAGWVIL